MGKLTRAAVSLNKATIGKKREQSRYFTPGTYKVRIDELKMVRRRKDKVELFLADTTILESEGDEAQKPGKCVWTVKTGLDAAASNMKELLVALHGIDPQNETAVEAADTDWDQALELALDDDQPHKNDVITIDARRQSTKDGGSFVRCYFGPAPE